MGANSSKRRTKVQLPHLKDSREDKVQLPHLKNSRKDKVWDKVWLLYITHTRGNRGTLSLNILREVCAFLHLPKLLAHVTATFIQFFNFQRETLVH